MQVDLYRHILCAMNEQKMATAATVKASDEVKDPSAVVAIDFGTTYTGYAFSLKGKENEILTSKHGGILDDDRVPTTVLLNPDKSFNSFGYKAQNSYGEKSEDERKRYFYMEHFKMALYRVEKLSRESTIKDIRKRDINALHVFTETIRYFHYLALKILMQKDLHATFDESKIEWILTIPAIWTDSARQFMREAATAAGIREHRLRLVLEPEAASLFCQENNTQIPKRDKTPVGHKYILADLGGGTADICVHEVISSRKLRELYRASGGDLGGNAVTNAYINFLKELFTEEVWNNFVEQYPYLFFEMIKDFERKKKTFGASGVESITIIMEAALMSTPQSRYGESLDDRIQQSKFKDMVTFKKAMGRIVLHNKLLQQFFYPTVNGILKALQEIIEACDDPELQTILLVGGFAESPYVREKVRETFPHMHMVLHNETRLGVLKGAVLMGFMPRSIVQRRARFTYGFGYSVPFIPGKHPESLKRTLDGEDWCYGVFDNMMIKKDQLLQYGDTFTREGNSFVRDMELKHKELHTGLWRSDRRNPVYCFGEPGEEDCERVGRIVLRPPAAGWPDYWKSEQQLIVGETEFTVKYINKTTGEEYEAKVNFL